jgi:hypothetical protein
MTLRSHVERGNEGNQGNTNPKRKRGRRRELPSLAIWVGMMHCVRKLRWMMDHPGEMWRRELPKSLLDFADYSDGAD